MTKNIVALGGGHGLSMLIRSLNDTDSNVTAIVSVADDGGSSGRLRHDMDIVAPGDIRSCMLALAKKSTPESKIFAKLFEYRFEEGELDGHSMGNLILVALARQLGSFESAVMAAAQMLDLQGTVLPATESSVVLVADTADGNVRGQVQIEKSNGINRVFIEPQDALPLAGVVEAILDADHILYAPGSLYTSVIPTFIIPEITHALKITSADVSMIMNLVNRGSDTESMSGDDHLRAVLEHGGRVDRVICDENCLKVINPPDGIEVLFRNLSRETDFHDVDYLSNTLRELFNI